MSSITEQDEQVLELIEADADEELDESDYRETLESVKDRLDEQNKELTKHSNLLNKAFSRIDELEEQIKTTEDDDAVPPIVRKARMSKEEREENLSKSEQLAALMHIFWDELHWEMGSTGKDIHGNKLENKHGVDTRTKANAKYNPSKLKYRLKDKADGDLHSTQIYRALRQLSIDSGGKEHSLNGRVEVRGGMYEYREVPTPDAKDVRRVVWKVEE